MEENNLKETDLKSLLEENLQLTKEIHAMTKSIKNYITFQKVLSVIYLLLFVVPLILSVIYLPQLINSYLNPYQNILNDGQNTNQLNSAQDILKQAQDLLNN